MLTLDILPGRLLRGGDGNEFEREPNGFLADSHISPLDYTDLTLASEVLLCAASFPQSAFGEWSLRQLDNSP